jgi:hypothetical protein
VAKAVFYLIPDAEARKQGDQTGLDTLVVLAVNYVYLVYLDSTPDVP